ncbi:MAG: NUDIX domain-containing protein [Myxococcales bacterium]
MPRLAFSVSIFARHGGKVLLIHHKRLGAWLPAGGEIEPGETPLEAAQRELLEETGLPGAFEPLDCSGLTGEPPGLLGYEEHRAGSKGTHLNFCFAADVPHEGVTANGEFDEWRWVGPDESIDCPRNVRELIARALGQRPAALAALGKSWLDRFNRRDLDGLLSLYADHAVHFSPKLLAQRPETEGRIAGKGALRAWWRDCFDRLPSLRYLERAVTAGGERVFLEYRRECDGQPPLDVAELLRCEHGRIVESRVYHG